jgi:hypothetical protein
MPPKFSAPHVLRCAWPCRDARRARPPAEEANFASATAALSPSAPVWVELASSFKLKFKTRPCLSTVQPAWRDTLVLTATFVCRGPPPPRFPEEAKRGRNLARRPAGRPSGRPRPRLRCRSDGLFAPMPMAWRKPSLVLKNRFQVVTKEKRTDFRSVVFRQLVRLEIALPDIQTRDEHAL